MIESAGNILIVDDTPDNLRLLSAMLAEQGYKVRKALSGQTAINTVAKVPPDLILLDINMPDMNGYQVCEQLKANETTQEIPIIFISALDDVLDKVKAFEVGGTDYITKPFQGQEVLARVKNQLTICRQRQELQAKNAHLEQEIHQREKAEEALRVYLHAVSHDLRNPVVGMSLLLKSILKHPEQDDNGRSPTIAVKIGHLTLMEESCDRQLNLINSLVEARQLEIEGVLLKCAPLSLHHLTEQLAAEWEPRLAQAKATLINQISPNLPQVQADADQLWRVFENLMANALKHNSTPIQITVSAEPINMMSANQPVEQDLLPDDAKTQHEEHKASPLHPHPTVMRCYLRDNGVGMPPKQAEQLFERYQRGKNARQTLGLGLGLYLCRQIIEAHQGQIGALSNPNAGVTFWFTLPIAAPATANSSPSVANLNLETSQT